MKFSDEELMVMHASGLEEAFDMLYDRHRHSVYRFALVCTFNEADAEDIVQEVFMRVSRAATYYRPQGKFKSWLFQIAANRIRTLMRTRNTYQERKQTIVKQGNDADIRTAETRLIASDLMEKALSALPDNQRMVLILKEVEGMSCMHIAQTMSISSENVRVLIHRARRAMITFIRGNQGDSQ